MKESLNVAVVKSFAELEELKHTWDRLAAARPREEIFHTFAWARAWWQAYSTKYEVYTPVVRNSDNEVVAIWPLVRCGSELRALGHGASDQNDLLTAPEIANVAFEAAMEHLANHRGDWETACISNISGRGLLLEAANSLARNLKKRIEIVSNGVGRAICVQDNPREFLRLACADSLETHRKQLEKLGSVTFRHLEDRGDFSTHLSLLQHQHIQRFALKGEHSHFLDPISKAHYELMPDFLAIQGPLRLSVLELDGRPVAYHFGFEYAGKFIWYKPTFDVDSADYAPAAVLFQSILQYCAAAGIQELDFTTGEESYENRFSSHQYEYFEINLFRRASIRQSILRAKERLKGNSAVAAGLKTFRAWRRNG